ncbi:MAG: uncharacterized protein KVP18_002004 [Porospora cf. gigantea A]|uniref:uncharacterized protein n=1 Tax=Porospora cf. gigantea A TaxID=2853593 RepID=UPI003559E441|nr:MAG: hypothetical protein KVP18_002004 [Porospora cf. gigantea A]
MLLWIILLSQARTAALEHRCYADESVLLRGVVKGRFDAFGMILLYKDSCPGELAVKALHDRIQVACVKGQEIVECKGKCPVTSEFYRNPEKWNSLGCEEWLSVSPSDVLADYTGVRSAACYSGLVRGNPDMCGNPELFACVSPSSVDVLWVGNPNMHVWAQLMRLAPDCPSGILGVNEPMPGLALVGCVTGSEEGNCHGVCSTLDAFTEQATLVKNIGCQGAGFRSIDATTFIQHFHKGLPTQNCFASLAEYDWVRISKACTATAVAERVANRVVMDLATTVIPTTVITAASTFTRAVNSATSTFTRTVIIPQATGYAASLLPYSSQVWIPILAAVCLGLGMTTIGLALVLVSHDNHVHVATLREKAPVVLPTTSV